MWEKNATYLLQPELDQTASIARLIGRGDPERKLVGVTRSTESIIQPELYDSIINVKSYLDIPAHLTVIPTGAPSTEALLAERDIVLNDITMRRGVLTVYDKKAFLTICKKVNLPIPNTYYALSDVPESAYPIFYKEAHEKGGGTRGIASSSVEVPKHVSGTLIFQEYIDSVGTYGVGFIAKDGKIIATHAHFERESFPISGGSAVVIETIDAPELISLTHRIVTALDYSGWGLAEFKYAPKSGTYVFMEVNAKFWASCDFAFQSEPAFARHLFKLDIKQRKIKRQFFLNRGFSRGPVFMLKNLRLILNSERVCYPGILKDFIRGFIPSGAKRFYRSMRARAVS